MSASIYWLSTNRKKPLTCWTPSLFLEALTRAFGDPPWTLDDAALPILRGMEAVRGEDPKAPSGFTELIRLIEAHGEIKVWAEW